MQPEKLLHEIISRIEQATGKAAKEGGGWWHCRCPAHQDAEPSLSVKAGDRGIVLTCFAGCQAEAIAGAIGMRIEEMFYDHDEGQPQRGTRGAGEQRQTPPRAAAPHQTNQRRDAASTLPPARDESRATTLSVRELAEAKGFEYAFLVKLGCKDWKNKVLIPYFKIDGTQAPRTRIRRALTAKKGSSWTGTDDMERPCAYGLQWLDEARKRGFLCIVEGETDTWTLRAAGYPVLGLPGAQMSELIEPAHLDCIGRIMLCREPDFGGTTLAAAMIERLRELDYHGALYVWDCGRHKDPNEAWLALGGKEAGAAFTEWLQGRLEKARLANPDYEASLQAELAEETARRAEQAAARQPAGFPPAGNTNPAATAASSPESGALDDSPAPPQNPGGDGESTQPRWEPVMLMPRQVAESFLEQTSAHLVYHRELHYHYHPARHCYRYISQADVVAWLARFVQDREWLVIKKQEAVQIPGAPTRTLVANALLNLQGFGRFDAEFSAPCWLDGRAADGIEAPRMLCAQNGLVDVDRVLKWFDSMHAGEPDYDPAAGARECICPHTADLFSLFALPYDFDLDATCPLWHKYLERVQPDAEIRATLQEWCGYCVIPSQVYKAILILQGPKDAGKSVFMETLEMLVGGDNCSAVSLDNLHETHLLQPLVGKLVNFSPEWGRIEPAAESILKAISGGDALHVNPKNKEGYPLRLPTRFVVSTNAPPKLNDRSDAIFDRLIPVLFAHTIPKAEQRPRDALMADLRAELPGILSWALQGLWRLVRRGRFTPCTSVEALKTQYRQDASPCLIWCENELVAMAGKRARASALYSYYREWCKDGGFQPLNEAHFGRTLADWHRRETGKELSKTRQTDALSGKRWWWYQDVAILGSAPDTATADMFASESEVNDVSKEK